MASSSQVLSTVQVFDYLYKAGDPTATKPAALPNAEIRCTLTYDRATSQSPVTNVAPVTLTTSTDVNGYWQFNLVPNASITPSNTLYVIQTPYSTFQISVAASPSSQQASSILANSVSVLSPATTNITGPLTVAGAFIASSTADFQGVAQFDTYAEFKGPDPWYDVRHPSYGAKGDNSTDDTAAFQAAINAAATAGGGIVYVPPGTYRIATSLTMKANVTLRGAGINATTLVGDDATAAAIITTSNLYTNTRNMTGANALGSFTVNLAAGGGAFFAANAWVFLLDTNAAFITKVKSVSTDTLTLFEALPFDFTSSGTAAYWTGGGLISGVVVEDMTVKCATIPSVTRPYIISLQYCERPIIRRVRGSGSLNYVFQHFACKNGLMVDSHAETTYAGTSGVGFDCQIGTGNRIQNCAAFNCDFGAGFAREAYSGVFGSTFGGLAPISARGVDVVICASCQVVGNNISDYAATGVKLSDSFGCTVSGNNFENIGSTGAAISIDGSAVNLCHHNSVTGNVVKNVGSYGIIVHPTGGAASAQYNVISGNVVTNTGNIAILIQSSYNTVVANSCDGYVSAGIWVDTSCVGNTVVGNTTKNGLVGNGIQTSNSPGGNYVAANNLNGEAIALAATDANTFTNQLSGDVTMTSANTWYSGPAVTLPAGTWLLTTSVTVRVINLGMFEGRINDGSTTWASTEMYGGTNGASVVLAMSWVVKPTASTTYTVQAASTTASNLIKAATFNNGVGNNASTITAARIA